MQDARLAANMKSTKRRATLQERKIVKAQKDEVWHAPGRMRAVRRCCPAWAADRADRRAHAFIVMACVALQADLFTEKMTERDHLRVQHVLYKLFNLDQRIKSEEAELEVRSTCVCICVATTTLIALPLRDAQSNDTGGHVASTWGLACMRSHLPLVQTSREGVAAAEGAEAEAAANLAENSKALIAAQKEVCAPRCPQCAPHACAVQGAARGRASIVRTPPCSSRKRRRRWQRSTAR